jgi:ABC-type multidrug transport system fused ATPase/permease subunit
VVEINCGQILIDNIDISRIRMSELRSRLSIILQEDGILFNSTVRENLDPHARSSDMELWECLEKVHLKELISSLPNKLGEFREKMKKAHLSAFLPFISDTCFSESGALLSFGQRQLFCLARAVLKGCSILVLDEATSNLDYETELLFLKAANDAFKGKTVITIAVSSLFPKLFLHFLLFTFIFSLHCSRIASLVLPSGLRSCSNYGEWKNNRGW